jgi:hypothetical protein
MSAVQAVAWRYPPGSAVAERTGRARSGHCVAPVLTHHPEDATPADGVTFLNRGPAEAVRIGLAAAGGKNLEVFSPTSGRQLLELGLIDEIDTETVSGTWAIAVGVRPLPSGGCGCVARRRRSC